MVRSPPACPLRPLKKLHGRGVDVPAVGGDFVGAGPGQMAALVTGMPGAGADIVGIEQEGVIGMKGLVVPRSVRRAGIARRTRWYGRGAISPGWRPASTGSTDPPASAGRLGARSRFALQGRLPPDPGPGFRNRRIRGVGGGERGGCWFRHWRLRFGRERWSGGWVPREQPVLDRASRPGKKPPRGYVRGCEVVTRGG